MPRVVHFEIHAGDCERAVKFYKAVFGWEFQKWEGPAEYWMVMTGPNDQPVSTADYCSDVVRSMVRL